MDVSLFDVAGPIMVGPSSSHTAGACKIGQVARALFNGHPTQVDFYLYGSFATVYQGHATDRALLAGVMKLKTSDPKLADAFEIAEQKKLNYKFIPIEKEVPEHHPNTVRIILKNKKRSISVVGSSIGGGEVRITFINDIPVDFEMMAGRFFSLIIGYNGESKALETLLKKLKEWDFPIREKQVICSQKKGQKNCLAMLNIEDFYLKLPQVLKLEKLPGIEFVRALTKLLK